MLKITNSVPVPKEQAKVRKGRAGDGRQEAILKLEVGESFWIATSVKSASSLKWWAKARYPSRDFTTKAESKGVRLWRTK